MAKGNSRYIPKTKHNPEYQARQIEKLSARIDTHAKHISAISQSHDNHISHLGNFARHDLKNAIQSMDSILNTIDPDEFDKSTVESLIAYLSVMRSTLDNFAKLVTYSSTGTFNLSDLMVAVELLARADMQRNGIDILFEYDRMCKIEISLPFQVILQMLNNLIINAIKALEGVTEKKILIKAFIISEFLNIEIKDNGILIPEDGLSKIFNYGYSSTGGSGIGLFHARYLCNEYKGKIDIEQVKDSDFNKTFTILLPLKLDDGKDDSNN